ncbi:MAG: DUF4388 domain-containing protein [Nitrospirota bacterium]
MNRIKILAMDDSPTVQKLLKMVLEEEGYEVISASDGIEGIDKARKERPALILIDFIMPKMNGYQVCKIIKEDPELKDIPIILVTSKGDEVGGKFVKMLGITEYLTKPFQPNDLISKIGEIVSRNSSLKDIAIKSQKTAEDMPSASANNIGEGISINEIVEPLISEPELREKKGEGAENIVELVIREVMDEVISYITETLPDLLREKILKVRMDNTEDAVELNKKNILLHGNLSVFRFPDVLQLIGIQKLTGCLSLLSGENKVNIYLRNGRIVFVSFWDDINDALGDVLVNAGKLSRVQLQHFLKERYNFKEVLINKRLITLEELRDLVKGYTEESMYKLFSWMKGSFHFSDELMPREIEDIVTELSTNDIILEGVRRVDEWQLINKKIGDHDAVLKKFITNAEELGEITLSDRELEILHLVDGKRDINSIIKESHMSEFEVCKILYVLLTANLLTVAAASPEPLRKQPQYL